jgi:predicted O-linked N-acetylglucosamine transferase (SPINDLY family)
MQAGRHKAAERLLKDVLRADANNYDALLTLGVLCGQRNDLVQSVRHLTHAVRRRPQSGEALYNLGQALIGLQRFADAAEVLTRAVAVADLPHVHEKLGDCLVRLDRLPEAAHHFDRAVARAGPNASGMLVSSLVEASRRLCAWSDLGRHERRLVEMVANGEPVEPLLLNYVTDDPAVLKRNAMAYATRFLAARLPMAPPLSREQRKTRPHRRLRVGYLCGDFRTHATSHLMAELFESHDRTCFEFYGLSFGPDDKSPLRKRIESAFEHFVDVHRLSTPDMVKRIQALAIDILVDLNGYIANSRPDVLMLRPASVQCHYLAFPGTLGMPMIDYLLADPIIAPSGSEADFTESLVRLPDCYQPNDSKREVAPGRPSRDTYGLPEQGVVLASFNNTIKLSPAMFEIWMRVLAAVPDSVLWLFSDNAWAFDHLRSEAQRAGIGPERTVLAAHVRSPDHLARLAQADLLLDSFPYGAHTTASDALWMGVPTLTLSGRSFASRVCASLLTSVGLPELIATSPSDYERQAIALASDPTRIASLKAHLAQQRTSPLFDTPRLARALEMAYAEMWRLWSAGDPARTFDVPATASEADPA